MTVCSQKLSNKWSENLFVMPLGRGPTGTITISREKPVGPRALQPQVLEDTEGDAAICCLCRGRLQGSPYNNPLRQQASHYLPAANSVTSPVQDPPKRKGMSQVQLQCAAWVIWFASTPRLQQLQSYELPCTSKHRFWCQPLANIVETLSKSCWSAAHRRIWKNTTITFVCSLTVTLLSKLGSKTVPSHPL